MRRLSCRCGQAVYFDNHRCGNCGRQLGFDPQSLTIRAEEQPGAGLPFCRNRGSAIACNWLVDAASPDGSCLSCQTSETIPSLAKPENLGRWRKLELAKRRLLDDLLLLGLPVDPARLRFVFKEDRRTNPDVHDRHVSTGHANGVITINAAEADEVYREQMRQLMNEPYRTLLGHFRHESGHYYFDLVLDTDRRLEARQLFGDESTDYDAALQQHYVNGPPPGWQAQFISSYASAHPAEDWAETWAHYLHINAVLETAVNYGLIEAVSREARHAQFVDLMLPVNEIMRSLGLADAYPFVITAAIAAKIEFVHRSVAAFIDRQAGPGSAAG